jgi:hypothetical protein
MKRLIGSHRPLLILALLLLGALLLPLSTTYSQSKEERMTLDQFKAFLRDEGLGRDLTQANHEELSKLIEGGPMSERVVRIGNATFIMNLALIFGVAATSLIVILMFFTPLGLAIFRGNLHSFIGAILKATGVSKRFGEHLMTKPKFWLHKEKSVRDAFGLYMHNDFIKNYKNNITAIAFIGTAFLILNIGLRGVKFMVAQVPDMIVLAIIVEITVLCLLGLTTWYEKEEDEEAGAGKGMPGKQLTLVDVERRLDALKKELEESVSTETGLRGQ